MAALAEVSTAGNWCLTHTNVVSFSYKWIITNFSKRPEKCGEFLKSSIFSASHYDKYGWCLFLYPNGGMKRDFIGLYLKLESIKNPTNSNVKADYKFSILNDKSEEKITFVNKCTQFHKGKGFGKDEFIDRRFLLNKANGLLPDDTLTIICHITTTFDTVTSSDPEILLKKAACDCNLSHDLGHLFENAKLKDVTLIVGKREIQAHRIILAARSIVFDAMFGHEMEESKLNRVLITDIDYEVIQEMLRYIYTGRVLNLDAMAVELLIAADKYALMELKKLCEIELCRKLSIETAADMIKLSDLHSAGNLKAQAIDFISDHAVEVLQTQGWKNMLMSHKDLITEVVEAIATWNGPPRKRIKN